MRYAARYRAVKLKLAAAMHESSQKMYDIVSTISSLHIIIYDSYELV